MDERPRTPACGLARSVAVDRLSHRGERPRGVALAEFGLGVRDPLPKFDDGLAFVRERDCGLDSETPRPLDEGVILRRLVAKRLCDLDSHFFVPPIRSRSHRRGNSIIVPRGVFCLPRPRDSHPPTNRLSLEREGGGDAPSRPSRRRVRGSGDPTRPLGRLGAPRASAALSALPSLGDGCQCGQPLRCLRSGLPFPYSSPPLDPGARLSRRLSEEARSSRRLSCSCWRRPA